MPFWICLKPNKDCWFWGPAKKYLRKLKKNLIISQDISITGLSKILMSEEITESMTQVEAIGSWWTMSNQRNSLFKKELWKTWIGLFNNRKGLKGRWLIKQRNMSCKSTGKSLESSYGFGMPMKNNWINFRRSFSTSHFNSKLNMSKYHMEDLLDSVLMNW